MRTILHCDLNNFYASVAMKENPELRQKAIAVGGSVEERHGIILAKNEEAKKFGVATGEPIWQARQKCANLIVVPPDFKSYTKYSKLTRQIYERYTDLIEPFGIDECWLDVTGSRRLFGTGLEIAERLRSEVKAELGLTISVGVSFNKIFAKIGSDLKKPDAVSEIPFNRFREIVWPMQVGSLLGIGRSTGKALNDLGIFTVGDLAAADPESLRLRLGKNGELLHAFANGNENSPVMRCDYVETPKSVGRSVTCPKDICCIKDAHKVLLRLSEEVAAQLRRQNLQAFSLQVSIRDCNLETHSFLSALQMSVQSADMIAKEATRLLQKNYDFNLPLRSIGVRVQKLEPYEPQFQLSFLEDRMSVLRHDALERSVDKIREKHGGASVVRASLIDDFKAFREQSPSTLGQARLKK